MEVLSHAGTRVDSTMSLPCVGQVAQPEILFGLDGEHWNNLKKFCKAGRQEEVSMDPVMLFLEIFL